MTNIIDANCWKKFVDDTLTKTPDWGSEIFEIGKKNGGFFIDSGGIIENEYISMKRPYAKEIFDAWAGNAIVTGKLKMIDVSGCNIKKELDKFGIPKSEHIYFRVAVVGSGKYIVSIDIDFFNPEKKKSRSSEKIKIIQNASGPVCTYMKKHYSIQVCCPDHFMKAVVAA